MSPPEVTSAASRRTSWPVAAWLLLLTVLAFGPLLSGGGYWLFGDMVFVPHQPWKDAWLGLDGSLPRAVPMDALVSAATQLLPGWMVQRVLLVGGYLVGGWGAARLVRGHGVLARCAAVGLFLWNPWVLERLLMGQWAILLGYLLLPWVAVTAAATRTDLRRSGGALWLALVATAVCSPSSGLMAVLTALVLGARLRRSSWWQPLALLGMGLAANLPWLLPTLLASTSTVSVDGVFAAFAARAESPAGTLASLASLGGTWKSSIVPVERESAVIVLLSCCLTVGALLGLRHLRGGEPSTSRLAVLAAAALAIALLPAAPGGTAALEKVASVVPGLALLRDSHRYLAPSVLVLVPGLAGAVDWLLAQIRPGRGAVWSAVVLAVVAPVLLLPSMVWGTFGSLPRSTYPSTWEAVATRISAADDGATVVLPWAGPYRAFDWNGGYAVLDPAPRYLSGEVLVDDRLIVDGVVLPTEDPRVATITTGLEVADPAAALREAGVRWVLVEGAVDPGVVPGGQVVVAGDGLMLLDLGPVGLEVRHRGAARIIAADVGVMTVTILLLFGQVYILLFGNRVRTPSSGRARLGRRSS